MDKYRSPYFRIFNKNISVLNNNLCFYLFVMKQFEKNTKNGLINKETKFISELFKENMYSKSINVKVKDLETEIKNYERTMLCGIFIHMYSYLDFFLEQYEQMFKDIKVDEGEKTSRLQALLNRIDKNLKEDDIFDDSFLYTLKYIRLRRNRIIHDNGQNSKDIAFIIRYKGEKIVDYWQNKLPKNVIDFRSENLSYFTHDELIGYFNISRLMCKEIDNKLLKHSNRIFILDECLNQFLQQKLTKYPPKIFSRKFSKFSTDSFGIKFTKDELESCYNKYIGV
ncbi:hypothetical protein [Desulfuribacillus alkaliarsenatis]|uniref:Uncharacterized protein n=1 Tax=Desulfuribacillus alkaliarsenatis TaxID=766136 RepID=A0A1E5G410_9FIRM|nr:hypothetical protein [Desulfuribacillus alkaliarsenatis]OEF97771.1 hypothetical protein BHF68_13865 [Desulfuribacillus alkaliarsenatis]